jgi:hypothetical protein
MPAIAHRRRSESPRSCGASGQRANRRSQAPSASAVQSPPSRSQSARRQRDRNERPARAPIRRALAPRLEAPAMRVGATRVRTARRTAANVASDPANTHRGVQLRFTYTTSLRGDNSCDERSAEGHEARRAARALRSGHPCRCQNTFGGPVQQAAARIAGCPCDCPLGTAAATARRSPRSGRRARRSAERRAGTSRRPVRARLMLLLLRRCPFDGELHRFDRL